MWMANIDLFDEYTAAIFTKLFEAFPRKISIDAREICGHGTCDEFGSVLNPEGKPSAQFEVALATIEWLRETGFIRVSSMHGFGAMGAVLTASALLVLKSTPESIKVSESWGERLVRFTREGSFGLAKETAKAVIGVAAGLAMPSSL